MIRTQLLFVKVATWLLLAAIQLSFVAHSFCCHAFIFLF